MHLRKIYSTRFTLEIYVSFVNSFDMSSQIMQMRKGLPQDSHLKSLCPLWIVLMSSQIMKMGKKFPQDSHSKSLCPLWHYNSQMIHILKFCVLYEWFRYNRFINDYGFVRIVARFYQLKISYKKLWRLCCDRCDEENHSSWRLKGLILSISVNLFQTHLMQMRKIFTTWFTFEIFVYFVNNFSMSSHTQTEHRFNKIPVCKKSERINVRKTWIFILVKKISMRFTFVVLAHKWEKDFQRYSHFKSSWTFLICFLRSEWFWYVMYVTRYFEGKNLTKHNISNWEKLYWEKSQTGIITGASLEGERGEPSLPQVFGTYLIGFQKNCL